MKKLINTVQTTFKALQLLSQPEIMSQLVKQVEKSHKKVEEIKGTFIYHKHFIVQVYN